MSTERQSKFEDRLDKLCSGCGRTLPLEAFYQKSQKTKEGQRYKTAYGRAMNPCRECRIARQKRNEGDLASKRRIRDANLRRCYGITADQYDAMLEAQGGVCAICDKPQGAGRYGVLHVDHCHATGRVRKLLCGPCNKGIGSLQDDPAILRKAAAYLEG